MFDKITISGYRGLSSLICEGLGDVNIIGGRNNCGKTSFLEAVHLSVGSCSGSVLIRFNEMRMQPHAGWEDIEPLFSDCDVSHPIVVNTFAGSNILREVKVELHNRSVAAYYTDVEDVERLRRELVTDTIDHSVMKGISFQTKFCYAKAARDPVPGALARDGWMTVDAGGVAPGGIFVSSSTRGFPVVKQLAKILDDKKGYDIVAALRTIDGRVGALTANNSQIKVDLEGVSKLLPINMLGDGMMRIIALLVAIDQCPEHGVVCADEIDNGLHYTAYLVLLRSMITFARRKHIQLFLSTHNLEFLQRVGEDEMLGETLSLAGCFSYINLLSGERGEPLPVRYDYSQFSEALASGLEVR